MSGALIEAARQQMCDIFNHGALLWKVDHQE
jgi:hypothetical protein